MDIIFDDSSRLQAAQSSFNIDAARLWIAAPEVVRTASNLYLAKKCILKYAKTLPI